MFLGLHNMYWPLKKNGSAPNGQTEGQKSFTFESLSRSIKISTLVDTRWPCELR